MAEGTAAGRGVCLGHARCSGLYLDESDFRVQGEGQRHFQRKGDACDWCDQVKVAHSDCKTVAHLGDILVTTNKTCRDLSGLQHVPLLLEDTCVSFLLGAEEGALASVSLECSRTRQHATLASAGTKQKVRPLFVFRFIIRPTYTVIMAVLTISMTVVAVLSKSGCMQGKCLKAF